MTKQTQLKKELEDVKKKLADNRELTKPLENLKYKLEQELESIKNQDLVGQCFIYKDNSYSVPSKPEDYWDVYYKVVGCEGEQLVILSVQKTAHGTIEIQKETKYFSMEQHTTPISTDEFDEKFKEYMDEIN